MRRACLAAFACVSLAGCTAPPPAPGDPEKHAANELKERLLGEWVVVSINHEPVAKGEDDLMLVRSDGTMRVIRETLRYRVLDGSRIEVTPGVRDRRTILRVGPRITAPAREEKPITLTVRFDGDMVTLIGQDPLVQIVIILKAARYGSDAAKTAAAERKPPPYYTPYPSRAYSAPRGVTMRGPFPTAAARPPVTGAARP